MSDKADERLSALMDSELDNFEQDIENLENSEQQKQRWMRYHLIRDVVRGHLPDVPTPDFDLAARVSAALEHEPTILAPRRFQPRQLIKQAAGLAIAATVSAIAIITIQNPQSGEQAGVAPLAATGTQSEKVIAFSPATPIAGNSTRVSLPATNSANGAVVTLTQRTSTHVHSSLKNRTSPSKFSGYLLNHNEYSISSNMQGMLPYMRIVGETKNTPMIIRIANDQ